MPVIGSQISPIATIAINATFLSERINNPCYQNVIPQKDNDLIEERLNTWSKLLGGEQQLKQRLQWDGLDLTTVRNLLGTAEFREDYTLPTWAETLKELIETTSASWLTLEGEDNSPLDSQNPLPFEDFYLPFIRVGRSKLSTGLSANSPEALLSREAYAALERSLLQQLVNLGTETLLFEFNTFRKAHPPANQTTTQDSRISYNTFFKNLLKDGGLAFFNRYPVLARLIATTLDLWVESTTEFIQRLQQDFSQIELTFSSDQPSLGKVQAIETSLSNPHHGRRSVLALTFSSGIKVVYKPKDLGLDVAFNQLLDWCNHQETSLTFKLTKILNRQGYGWVEFIEQQPCENQAAVQRFYQRAGMLLSLLHLLGASSCDHQNVVASGEYPSLIDADLLMHPVEHSVTESEDWFKYSVLHTGFLPGWEGDIYSANAQDSSVLGNIWPKQINSSREWKFINTDGMHLAPNKVIIPAGTNVVILDGKTVSAKNYVEEIVTGFEEIYHLLTKNREMLLGEESPLCALQFLKSRFSLRPTLTYGMVSKRSLSPQYLRNGADYSILIDFLSRHYLMGEENLGFKELLGAETTSLQQLDIPYFTVSCHSTALELASAQPIKHFFKTSSYQRLIAKIPSLDEEDVARQIKLIRASFYAKYAHLNKNSAALQGSLSQFSSLNPDELLEEAIAIGNSLVANRIQTGDGCNWIDLDYMSAKRYQLQVLDDSLFTGRAGVSLFLAALAKITGEQKFKEVALAALSPLRQSLKKAQADQSLLRLRLNGIKLGGILGLMGLGGIIYSLVKISQFLQEPALLEDAQQTAKLITADVIAADQTLDIIFGVAGAIMGLLTLYQETGEKVLLDIAVACGNHLLSQRTDTAPRAWKTVSKTPLTGFSHGAAGNSFSLLQLYAATADKVYLEAAKEGIEYETSVFDTSVRNWPDFLSLEQTNQMDFRHAWCHGSAGIGLARLGSSTILQTEEIYSDIEVALETTKQYAVSSLDVDHLCCGSLGRIELFVVASQKLGNQEWLNTAREQAASVVNRTKNNGAYAFLPHFPNSVFSPNFFKGSAGVGYQLLRLASPASLPSVLIWE
ncbi:type 2 lanthipeptide synthetase LanM family protein [Moorena bouillonii]|uniref:Lanthionine synthetase n=1 Tax=Moorena bouillonii PNG TaxID=568701 RepID=A0A1U7N124_9CYAN|nr:type 2 lanthipeptide synthetase LanM family protein [Moorena bouillonii]OLT59665.1 lanthionine synthetase [Moorena bouillonii PNG]